MLYKDIDFYDNQIVSLVHSLPLPPFLTAIVVRKHANPADLKL